MTEEKAATTPSQAALRWVVLGIAVAMSLYHMYVAGFGPPEAMIFRGTHLLFALTLVFLLYPLRPGGAPGWRALDALLLLGAWGFVLNIFLNYKAFTYRVIYIDELTRWDMFYAVVSVLIAGARAGCRSCARTRRGEARHAASSAPPLRRSR